MPLPKTIDYIKCERMLNRKILVYLGNITANKNQKELVSAMKNLDENYIALFLGRECDKGEVRELCISNGLEKKCIIAGFCDEVPSVLEYCSLNILLSKNEGFGLSIIESATYGVPSIMFSDLDAAEDLCVGGIASPIAVRENKVVIQKIQDCIKGGCGKQQLKKEVQRFSMDNIGKKYSLWYRTINHLKGDN